jgi:hypothetical protein
MVTGSSLKQMQVRLERVQAENRRLRMALQRATGKRSAARAKRAGLPENPYAENPYGYPREMTAGTSAGPRPDRSRRSER